jgi:hypothetical protein
MNIFKWLKSGRARYKKDAQGNPIKFKMPAPKTPKVRGKAKQKPKDWKKKRKKKRKMAKESRRKNRWANQG